MRCYTSAVVQQLVSSSPKSPLHCRNRGLASERQNIIGGVLQCWNAPFRKRPYCLVCQPGVNGSGGIRVRWCVLPDGGLTRQDCVYPVTLGNARFCCAEQRPRAWQWAGRFTQCCRAERIRGCGRGVSWACKSWLSTWAVYIQLLALNMLCWC